MPAFRPPEWKNARTTLTWAAVVFAVLFLGIAYLVIAIGIIPDRRPADRPPQPARAPPHRRRLGADRRAGGDRLILVLAANTSFADFPRLSSFLARDDFLPRQFAFRGERLAFTTGIVALSAMAIALLIGFSASISGLIPLYTLGVFIAFTLSQGGMLARWWTAASPAGGAGLRSTG